MAKKNIYISYGNIVKYDNIYRKFKTWANSVSILFRRTSRRKTYRERVHTKPWTEGEKHHWELQERPSVSCPSNRRVHPGWSLLSFTYLKYCIIIKKNYGWIVVQMVHDSGNV